MYFRIWKESTIPVEGGRLICSSPLAEKYADFDSAKEALKKLAENKFNASKYRMKKIKSIKKISEREYVVTSLLREEVTDTYSIYPKWWKG